MSEPTTRPGWVSDRLRDEFPQLGLTLLDVELERKLGRSPRGVRERLALMANRFRGADALVLRQRPVPHAYRVFFRHIGLDPDVTRVPVEAAAVERLVKGGFVSHGLLDDALTIGLMETGVPLWALDGDQVEGRLGLRLSGEREQLGEGNDATPLPPGRIVIADERGPISLLFGDVAAERSVTKRTRRVQLFAVVVAGVSALEVEEAMWACAETLRS
ncbi:phenylalanine--tRNA ligase beta subunit-related protein [Conexibacter sp. CPCC 206217]|uniref:phenylalanine--tRNA ligase beta subunit-related protein n=1 Tax=Conexibacter sp. CPCC 206217 TaxID=3064574 RepID=UPI00272442A4|nr:phenylalanine--tRNA ligase beta subunit-related protein [Conexibacter sp. CPCC 206217]MDO8209403.1 phenylalanine--tRNA ligase beta subunit-related protein [Conexibacter sp. CPCC 206217]